MTRIAASTLLAYLDCRYQVLGDVALTLRVGECNPQLLQLYERFGCDCAAFLTAWNPLGQPCSDADNLVAQAHMETLLRARGHQRLIEAVGRDPAGQWRAEQSVLVPGMSLTETSGIAAQFRQNAFVWMGADARPQLLLLR